MPTVVVIICDESKSQRHWGSWSYSIVNWRPSGRLQLSEHFILFLQRSWVVTLVDSTMQLFIIIALVALRVQSTEEASIQCYNCDTSGDDNTNCVKANWPTAPCDFSCDIFTGTINDNKTHWEQRGCTLRTYAEGTCENTDLTVSGVEMTGVTCYCNSDKCNKDAPTPPTTPAADAPTTKRNAATVHNVSMFIMSLVAATSIFINGKLTGWPRPLSSLSVPDQLMSSHQTRCSTLSYCVAHYWLLYYVHFTLVINNTRRPT